MEKWYVKYRKSRPGKEKKNRKFFFGMRVEGRLKIDGHLIFKIENLYVRKSLIPYYVLHYKRTRVNNIFAMKYFSENQKLTHNLFVLYFTLTWSWNYQKYYIFNKFENDPIGYLNCEISLVRIICSILIL